MTKIAAKSLHAHYLFEEGVLEFEEPVEIHVCRFGPNMQKIHPDTVPSYPKYQVHFEEPAAFKVYVNSNEAYHSPNRENIDAVIANHQQYDLILTIDKSIIEQCPNAILFPYGSTWLNTGHIDHPDGLGKFDEDYMKELWSDKKFELSFVCTSHYRTLDGYELRKHLWIHKDWLKIPLKFYGSNRMPIPDEGVELLPDDDKRNLFHSQFSIAIENCSIDDYFTEKLIDCFVTKTVPVYFGCKNIGEYFDTRGMIIIENDDVHELIKKVNELTPETYDNMLPYVEENYNRSIEYARSYAERIKEQIDIAIENKKKNKSLLSIGVLTLDDEERKILLNRLLSFLNMNTSDENRSKIEIMVNIDDGTKSVGQKRNEILDRAKGDYVCFIDDDDLVDEEYCNLIVKTIEENDDLDCIGFAGMYYVDGNQTMLFKHANEYGGHYKDGFGIQHRPVNHLNPVRTEYAKQIRFPEKDFGEDSDYCDRLLESGLLKNEVVIQDKIMYHYLWSQEGSRTHA